MFYSKKLKKFKNINHYFFSRKGGYSKGIYKGLNCGQGSKDNKKNIQKNLSFVSKLIGIKKKRLFLMHQTHSNKVIVIDKKNKNLKSYKSDAIVTQLNNCGIGVVTADCVPILIYDNNNQAIACIHAGWKGALNGIIENTAKKLKKLKKKNDLYACVGPCIGMKSYEVDLNFYRKFISKTKKNTTYFSFKNKNKKLFNLRKYVSDKLLKLGAKVDHINYDTFREKKHFFSYRRSIKIGEKDYGRCISIVGLTKFSQN